MFWLGVVANFCFVIGCWRIFCFVVGWSKQCGYRFKSVWSRFILNLYVFWLPFIVFCKWYSLSGTVAQTDVRQMRQQRERNRLTKQRKEGRFRKKQYPACWYCYTRWPGTAWMPAHGVVFSTSKENAARTWEKRSCGKYYSIMLEQKRIELNQTFAIGAVYINYKVDPNTDPCWTLETRFCLDKQSFVTLSCWNQFEMYMSVSRHYH